MNKKEFFDRVTALGNAFPGSISTEAAHLQAWFEVVQHLEDEDVARAVGLIKREMVSIPRGANVGALILQHAKPKVTENTYEGVLSRAVALNRGAGDPYAYLRGVDPELVRIAEENDLFNRDLSASDIRWTIRSIARQRLEAVENEKRGYRAPEVAPPGRQIPGPARSLTDEDRAKGKAKIAEIMEMLSRNTQLENRRAAGEPNP